MLRDPTTDPTTLLSSDPDTRRHEHYNDRVREIAQRVAAAMEELLALKQPSAPATARSEHLEIAPAGTARILVADDEPMLLSLMQRRLTALGHDVTTAPNGRVAYEIAEQQRVDLILTDINMPELDGLSLLAQLKANARTRDIPVIVVSSQSDLGSVAACIEAGAEDHLVKPPEPQLLEARVRSSLERKRLRDLELVFLRDVAELTAAAERVDEGAYEAGTLAALASRRDANDPLGRLARVFDRMVGGIRSREERFKYRLHQLRHEMGEASDQLDLIALESDESPFASGELLASRYEILGHLGRGGMGMVYHARDNELGEEVAIKVVRRDLVKSDPTILERLKSEIRLARRISHPNVVRAHDLGEWKGTYFITMEYVRGISLEELVDRRGRLSVASTLAIATQMLDALATAHDCQIVHRDIKPSNLLVDERGALKVMDFGIARCVDGNAMSITAGGFIVGTPQYMAPEQLMGGVADARSDIFSAAVVLYECLTGRPPFPSDSPSQLLALLVDSKPTRLRELHGDIPPRLESILHQQLQLHPGQRAQSARELANVLSEIEHTM